MTFHPRFPERRPLPLFLTIVLALGLLPSMSPAATTPEHLILFLADTSGTLRQDLDWPEASATATEKPESKDRRPSVKIELLQELLARFSENMPCPMGILTIRYIAGNETAYEEFLPIESHQDVPERTKRIRGKFPTDYPVFNRRTPLADLFRQVDERILANHAGPITLILLSDGKESFFDPGDDAERSRKSATDGEDGKDDAVHGPLSEVRRLKERHGERLMVHTVLVDTPHPERREKLDDIRAFYEGGRDSEAPEGEDVLNRMAWLGGGGYFAGTDLYERPDDMALLCGRLCGAKKPVLAAAPAAVSAPYDDAFRRNLTLTVLSAAPAAVSAPALVAVASQETPATPNDADQDGVPDAQDRCPGTPRGAAVDATGCWTLPGVLFATDRWEIRPHFASLLDEAVAVLQANPELRVAIQGHTADSRASDAHNQTLSQRRAASVRDYLIRAGIPAERLTAEGFGESRPVADNATALGRAKNRRVELVPVPAK